MGRRKIEIVPVSDRRHRVATFNKRKWGLLRKAMELSILCQVDMALVFVFQDRTYQFSSNGDIDSLLAKAHSLPVEEQWTNEDVSIAPASAPCEPAYADSARPVSQRSA
jgi:hypothetical protein